jgi:group I intron endonuclease
MESDNNIFHYVYKIVNTINNKYYYGVHSTNNLEDDYMGSGTALGDAKEKHGIENFHRDFICFTNNEQSAYDIEELIVDEKMVKRRDCYNVSLGGRGGNTMAGADEEKRKEWTENISKGTKAGISKMTPGAEALRRQRVSEAVSGSKNPMYNKKHKQESKDKMKKNRPDTGGSNNPRYVHLSFEQETFIIEQKNKGIPAYKIPQPFYETFGIKISNKITYRILKK